jgi:hypothetical protein
VVAAQARLIENEPADRVDGAFVPAPQLERPHPRRLPPKTARFAAAPHERMAPGVDPALYDAASERRFRFRVRPP